MEGRAGDSDRTGEKRNVQGQWTAAKIQQALAGAASLSRRAWPGHAGVVPERNLILQRSIRASRASSAQAKRYSLLATNPETKKFALKSDSLWSSGQTKPATTLPHSTPSDIDGLMKESRTGRQPTAERASRPSPQLPARCALV